MDSVSIKKSINFLNKAFLFIVIFDILLCGFQGRYDFMFSSVLFLVGLLIARVFFKYEKHEAGTLCISLTLYFIGFYHVVQLDNYTTCYFILLTVPLVGTLLLFFQESRFFLFFASFFLFPLCNYLAGLPLLENYIFYYGLIPSFISVLYFAKLLRKTNHDKSRLIHSLQEKNEEILLYSKMMSHDLKAPLRTISSFSSILERKMVDLNEKDKKLFSYITNGVDTMRNLIDDLILYSRSSEQGLEFSQVDLQELTTEVLEVFKHDIKENKVEVTHSGLQNMYGHRDLLFHVFQNLISNAIKYQPKDEFHIPKLEIYQVVTDTSNQLIISDNGIGIEQDKVNEIFEPFKRLHSVSQYEGTGLGMAIVSKIVSKHNGHISVESEPGKGTKIIIDFNTDDSTL